MGASTRGGVTLFGDGARGRFGEAPAAAVGARTGGAATAATAAAAASTCTLGRFGAGDASSAAGRSVTFRASSLPRTATFAFDGLLMRVEMSLHANSNSGNARAASDCDAKRRHGSPTRRASHTWIEARGGRTGRSQAAVGAGAGVAGGSSGGPTPRAAMIRRSSVAVRSARAASACVRIAAWRAVPGRFGAGAGSGFASPDLRRTSFVRSATVVLL